MQSLIYEDLSLSFYFVTFFLCTLNNLFKFDEPVSSSKKGAPIGKFVLESF